MRLGCAGSSFEFDNHPREEYFQEPSTWHGAAAVRLPAARDKRPLSLVLKDLEAPEVDIINMLFLRARKSGRPSVRVGNLREARLFYALGAKI